MIPMENIPPQLQNQIRLFQQSRDSLQTVAVQKQQFELQVRELTRTLEALEKTAEDQDVYRSVGAILVRVTDRPTLKTELSDQKETLEVRLKALERQENSLKDRLKDLQGQIEKALGGRAGGLTEE